MRLVATGDERMKLFAYISAHIMAFRPHVIVGESAKRINQLDIIEIQVSSMNYRVLSIN